MHFPSKKDFWLFLVVWGAVLICFMPLFTQTDIEVLFFTIPTALFLGWLWLSTGYEVRHETLIIQSGPIKKSISIRDITHIKKTKSLLSAPALSLDRLEIQYGRFGMALISPKDQYAFVTALTDIHPNIEIDPTITR